MSKIQGSTDRLADARARLKAEKDAAEQLATDEALVAKADADAAEEAKQKAIAQAMDEFNGAAAAYEAGRDALLADLMAMAENIDALGAPAGDVVRLQFRLRDLGAPVPPIAPASGIIQQPQNPALRDAVDRVNRFFFERQLAGR